MKQFFKWIEDSDVVLVAFAGGLSAYICWIIYKILAGAYHLLDKLIERV